MDASAFYDIADVNPHPELDPPICRDLRIPIGHRALDLNGTTQRVQGTDKQDQQSVARCPHDSATVFFNLGFNELSMVSIQLGQGAFIVDAYQAAVLGYIRHKNCDKSAFDFLTSHGVHSTLGRTHFRPIGSPQPQPSGTIGK